jgi:hypothetical protein
MFYIVVVVVNVLDFACLSCSSYLLLLFIVHDASTVQVIMIKSYTIRSSSCIAVFLFSS